MIHHYSVIHANGVVGVTSANIATLKEHGLAYADVKGKAAGSRVVAYVRLAVVPPETTKEAPT